MIHPACYVCGEPRASARPVSKGEGRICADCAAAIESLVRYAQHRLPGYRV